MLQRIGWIRYAKEILRGKDSARILTNASLLGTSIDGAILDVGGGGERASHFRFLTTNPGSIIKTADINPKSKPDIVINLEHEALPLGDGSIDHALAFNIFEHLSKRRAVAQEIRRVLKAGGSLIGSVPFLVNVHPDPKDFVRLTRQGLEELFAESGFRSVRIQAVGRGPFTAALYQVEFLFPRVVRLLASVVVWGLDESIMRIRPRVAWTERQPLAYFFVAQK